MPRKLPIKDIKHLEEKNILYIGNKSSSSVVNQMREKSNNLSGSNIIKKLFYKFLKKIIPTFIIIPLIISCSSNEETDISNIKNTSERTSLILAYEESLNNLYNENVSSLVKISILYPGITEPVTGSGFVWDLEEQMNRDIEEKFYSNEN